MLRAAIGMLCALAFAHQDVTPAAAQAYPSKTIRIIVPFGPGGPADLAGRLIGQILQSELGQSVVVENRAGAGGSIGTKAVATADPDGYTLLLGASSTLAVVPAMMKSPGFDPVGGFAPVSRVSDSATVLIVNPAFPVNSMQELVSYGRANPGKLTYASAGVGSQTHLEPELLNARTGIGAVHIPYKSGGEMATAVLTNQVQFSLPDVSILLGLIQDKKVKPLAVTSEARHPQLPDVPTMAEGGVADFVTGYWTGVVAPAGTPPDVVEKLNGAIERGLKSQPVRDTLARIGSQTHPSSVRDFAAFIAAEQSKWVRIAKTANINPE
jgi:tripartite-type tricarboxylate transporter receptor subunit TctC